MKKSLFLELMDGIDDDLIENYLGIPSNRIRITRKPHYLQTALGAAAAVCIVAAGVFGVSKLRILPHSPNESISTISSGVQISDSASESAVTSSEKLGLYERGEGEPFEFRIFEGYQNPVYTDTVTKKDNEQYATLEIKTRGNLSLSVYRADTRSCVGRTSIDDGGTFTLFIDYLEEVKEGEELYLSIYASENSIIEGKWAP